MSCHSGMAVLFSKRRQAKEPSDDPNGADDEPGALGELSGMAPRGNEADGEN